MEVLQRRRQVGKEASARKLAASLWRVAVTADCSGGVRWQCGLINELGFQFCSAPPSPKSSMEGVTKWDYINHSRLNEAKTEGFQTSRLKRSAKKLDEEVSSPITTNHQNIYHKINDMIDDNRRERNNCEKTTNTHLQLLYAKLVSDFEKEKKAREILEYLCIQQAEEIKANRDEISKLRNLCKGIQREAAEDRKMLQVAEAWREERAQMKLGDAKLMLEEKYSQLSDLITHVRNFLPSSSSNKNM